CARRGGLFGGRQWSGVRGGGQRLRVRELAERVLGGIQRLLAGWLAGAWLPRTWTAWRAAWRRSRRGAGGGGGRG
ncbi:MAG: hypothetical protein J0H22_05570, partial [Actinobacteria bacterium]|nr:hypothetical protein [Actinomycetota bacterium]